MELICLKTGPLGTNTYIVYEGAQSSPADCVVIDPAASRPVLQRLEELGLRCTHILLTHGHFDHIMGVSRLREEFGARVYIHALDAPAVTGGEGCLAYMAGANVSHCEVDGLLEDGAAFSAAGLDFRVVHTPGHTPGGVCFVLEKEGVVFTGDTLFRLSVGRTDLPGGNGEQLYESIAYRLFTLKGDLRVLPGHEEETTLDFERRHNPYMRSGGLF